MSDRRLPCAARAVCAALLLCISCAAPVSQPTLEPITDCEAVGRARPICGFQNPEDLALLPDGITLLVSEYGDLEGGRAGDLASFDTQSEVRSVLFRGGDAGATRPTAGWGELGCPGPPGPGFSPHGIHLDLREDGALQLLAVQHGERESIEFFEVVGRAAPGPGPAGPARSASRFGAQRGEAERRAGGTGPLPDRDPQGSQRAGAWELAWRGCVMPPPDSYLNDVVALPGGGLAATHMLPRSERAQGVFRGFERPPAGFVLEWNPGVGFRRVLNSEMTIANGIERSPDGRILYVNSSGDSELIALARESGLVLRRIPVPLPDNSTWAPDGRLIVASLIAGFGGTEICQTLGGRACPAEFQLLAIDPTTGSSEVLYRNAGPPMGAGTVGLQVGHALFAGSFRSDRLLRIDLP